MRSLVGRRLLVLGVLGILLFLAMLSGHGQTMIGVWILPVTLAGGIAAGLSGLRLLR